MRNIPITLLALVLATPSLPAGISPFPPHDVRLDRSFVTEREDWNIRFIRALDTDRLLHNFRVTAGIPSSARPMEGWEAPHCGLRGHFVGHYLSAVSALADRLRDEDLQARLNALIDGLDACQQKSGNGFLSAFPEEEFVKLERTGQGIWAPYYTWHKLMQGLVDAYRHTGNRKAYRIALGMAGYIGGRMAKLDRATIDRMMDTNRPNPANEMGGMNDVLHQLHQLSGDAEHLRLARLFEPDWFLSPLVRNEDNLSGLHANTHIALVNGFAQAFTDGHDPKYRDASLHFWEMLMRHHAYANGSSSGPRPVVVTPTSKTAEHWGDPDRLAQTLWSPGIAESCVSHNTRRLTATLFRWTGDPRYADAGMNLFYNAVLPTQSPSTGRVVYHLPLGAPCAKKYLHDHDYVCCSGSGMEAFANLQAGIYCRDAKTLYVNQYIPSTLTWNEEGFKLRQEGDFPYTPVADFTVVSAQERDLTLNLLIPSWAEKTEIQINGTRWTGPSAPLSYAALTRKWRAGDRVRITFQPAFRLVPVPGDPNVAALFYGPLMLAFETGEAITLRGNKRDILGNLSVSDRKKDGLRVKLTDGDKTYTLRPLMDIDGESYGVYAAFAN